MVLDFFGHQTETWAQLYGKDLNFCNIYNTTLEGKNVHDFYIQDGLVFHIGHICVPSEERKKLIWEAHYSRVAGHFGIGKTTTIL